MTEEAVTDIVLIAAALFAVVWILFGSTPVRVVKACVLEVVLSAGVVLHIPWWLACAMAGVTLGLSVWAWVRLVRE